MKAFQIEHGLVMPLDRANVDTDFIIPKQFLKSIRRSGFGANLFDEHRYLDPGVPDGDNRSRPINPDFVLNEPRYQGASILLARDNFGCGSSREHAPWALDDYGFRAIIAPSFADIFFNNCFKNGILPIVLPRDAVDRLFREVEAEPGYRLRVELPRQVVVKPGGEELAFAVGEFGKHCLLHGLDDIGITLQDEAEIRAFEERWRERSPWNFAASGEPGVAGR